MGFKLNKKTGKWSAWYSKRHPITQKPIQLRRSGFKSKAEAKKVETQLIVEVEDKVRKKVLPSWFQLVHEYHKSLTEQQNCTAKTAYEYLSCLRVHTFEGWVGRRTPSPLKRYANS